MRNIRNNVNLNRNNPSSLRDAGFIQGSKDDRFSSMGLMSETSKYFNKLIEQMSELQRLPKGSCDASIQTDPVPVKPLAMANMNVHNLVKECALQMVLRQKTKLAVNG